MEIKIGESLFLGGDSDYKLSPPIQGLESPAFRVGDGLYSGRDGGFVSGHYYGHRTIVLKGFYIGRTCEDASAMRRVLFGLLRIRYKLPIIITTAEGEFYTEGFVSNVKSDLQHLNHGEYQITLLCPDPIIYKSENEKPFWYEQQLPESGTASVSNPGDVETYPIITIRGITSGFEITNATTEQTMQVDITTTEATDEIIVDMQNRIITLNGSSINEYRSLLSSWWPLVQEVNEISVSGVSEGDSGLIINSYTPNSFLSSLDEETFQTYFNDNRPLTGNVTSIRVEYEYNSGSPNMGIYIVGDSGERSLKTGSMNARTATILDLLGLEDSADTVEEWILSTGNPPTSDFTSIMEINSTWNPGGQGLVVTDYTNGEYLKNPNLNSFQTKLAPLGIHSVLHETVEEPVEYVRFKYYYNNGSPLDTLEIKTESQNYVLVDRHFLSIVTTNYLSRLGINEAAEIINQWIATPSMRPTSDFEDTLYLTSYYSDSVPSNAIIKYKKGYAGI